MTARLKGRRREAESVVADATRWAQDEGEVEVFAVVGSYARGAERLGSDVDLMVLCSEGSTLAEADWFKLIRPKSRLLRVKRRGPVHERRYRLPSGLQVEVNVATSEWAAVPLDSGSARVLRDGYRSLYDPQGILSRAGAAARS